MSCHTDNFLSHFLSKNDQALFARFTSWRGMYQWFQIYLLLSLSLALSLSLFPIVPLLLSLMQIYGRFYDFILYIKSLCFAKIFFLVYLFVLRFSKINFINFHLIIIFIIFLIFRVGWGSFYPWGRWIGWWYVLVFLVFI